MNRTTVYQRIDGERDYQDEKHGPIDIHAHAVVEWLLIMRHKLRAAEEAWIRSGDGEAIDEVRKIAAVAVACMEQHGCLPRAKEPR